MAAPSPLACAPTLSPTPRPIIARRRLLPDETESVIDVADDGKCIVIETRVRVENILPDPTFIIAEANLV